MRLGMIVDIDALDMAPSGYIRVDVPEEWLVVGGTFELDMPRRVACNKCGGGGCLGCGLSGAYELHKDSNEITFRTSPGKPTGQMVRLQPPPSSIPGTVAILLIVDMHPASKPSDCIRRLVTT